MEYNNLTNEQIVKKLKELDIHSFEHSQLLNILIERNRGLIVNAVSKYTSSGTIKFSDLESMGEIALIKSLNTYKKDKGMTFSSYAYNYIRSYIKNECRKNFCVYKNIKYYSLDEILDKNIELKSNYNLEEDIEEEELRNLIIKEIDKISNKRICEVIKMYFGFNDGYSMTYQEIGDTLNITKETVRQNILKGLIILRENNNLINLLKSV